MKSKLFKSLLVFSFTALTLSFVFLKTQAATAPLDVGISVSPVKAVLDANPGDVLEQVLTIYNATPTDLTIYPYFRNFESDNVSGAPQFITETLPLTSSLKDWIKFDADSYVIKKVTDTNTNALVIKYHINIPKDAEPGGHYAAIMFTINDPKKQLVPDQGNIAFSADTGTLILLNIKGNVSRNLELTGFTAVDPFVKDKKDGWLFEFMPVEFDTTLLNTGNTHAFPLGNIIIYQGDKQVQKLVFNDSQAAILKESSREFSTVSDTGFVYVAPVMETINGKQSEKKYSNGDTETQLSFNWDKVSKQYIGPYKAKLMLVYDDNGLKKSILAEKDFWILPWKLILVILVVVIGYITLKIKYGREPKKK